MNVINDPSIVHETVIRDIVSLITDTPINIEKIKNNLTNTSKFSYRNIARASKDLTLTFPVIVSDSVSVETASMISKAIERKAVTMLQMLFSAIQITNADNALSYLKNFHTNINADSNMGVDDWISIGNVLSTREEALEYMNFDIDAMNEANFLTHLSNAGAELNKAVQSAFKSAKRGIVGASKETSKAARKAAISAEGKANTFAHRAKNVTKRMAKNGEMAARLGAEDALDTISSSSNSLAAKIAAASSDLKKSNKAKYGLKEDCGFDIVDEALFEEAIRQFREFGEFFLEESYSSRSLNDYMVDMAHGNRVINLENNDIKPQRAASQPDEETQQKRDMITKGVDAYNGAMNKINNTAAALDNLPGVRHVRLAAEKIPGAKQMAMASGVLGMGAMGAHALGSAAGAFGDNKVSRAIGHYAKTTGELAEKINVPKRVADYAGNKIFGKVRADSLAGTKVGKAVAGQFGKFSNAASKLANSKNAGFFAQKAGKLGTALASGMRDAAKTNLYQAGGKLAAAAGIATMVGGGLHLANQWRLNKKAEKQERLRQQQMQQQGYHEDTDILNENQGNQNNDRFRNGVQAANQIANIANTAVRMYNDYQNREALNTKTQTGIQKDLAGIQKDLSDVQSNTTTFFSKQIVPTDIQKANEAIPTMMIINFVSKGDGEHPITSQAVIGVKARLQYVSSKDMMDRIVSKNSDSNGLFKFIKATTGQISFWKDFVFALDKAKVDSIASSGKGSSSPVWKMLERRATLSRIKRWTGSVNDAAAISTIVISREEADAIKKNERMDLDRVNAVHSVMNGYNIMGFVIVDESLERASFLFDDGSSSYETISFTHLERQGNDGGAYKKVINLLTKNR